MKNNYNTVPSGGMRGRHLFGRGSATHQESVKLRLITVQQRPMSLTINSSSTPTVPYSTADILYGSEVNGNRVPLNDDVRQNSFGDMERSRDSARQKSKELEQSVNNRRPSSKSGKQKSLTIDSVAPFDKDREDPLKSLSSTLPPTKPSHHLRPNGIRSNIVKPDFCPKANGAITGRDQDDLVAMGTLWSPNNNNPAQPPPPVAFSSALIAQQQQQSGNRNNSVSNSNTNSFPSKVVSMSSVNQSMSSSNNTLNTQRKYPGNNIRPIVVQNNVPGRKVSNSMKEQEDPKYTDPMFGAPASFQQRIIELGALEGDTVRWERSKRLKKKKQDRDS